MQKDTDTACLAHVLLPAAGWGEKDGTVTNSERRISRQRPFIAAPGEARPDWWHLAEVGRRLGYADAFDYPDAASVFAEHAELSALDNADTRDFDIGAYAGIDRAAFDALSPFQWPQPKGTAPASTRFFADGGFFTPDGKGRFIAVSSMRPSRTDDAAPFLLNTGRIRDQWHTMTRTGKTARLSAHMAEPFAEINPADAAELGIAEAALVELSNGYGCVVVRALFTDRQPRGGVFVPMHWTDAYSANARVDALVAPRTDPVSGQPALKHVAVALRPAAISTYGFAVLAERPEALDLPYWALAKAEGGWRIELGFSQAPEDMAGWARQAFGIDPEAELLAYADRTTGQGRYVFFADGRLLAALYVAAEPVAVSRNWVVAQLAGLHADRSARLAMLAGRPGAGQTDPGAIVCSCFSVGVNQISTAIAGGCANVEAIGATLNAGTNCGSCRAEIRGMIDALKRQAAE
jgi:assimilatory nitrate reductase catalytic subunit